MNNVHVVVVRSINNVVENNLFYKGLQVFEVVKNQQKSCKQILKCH